MLADPLVLTVDSVESTWAMISRTQDGVVRLNEATSLTEPEKITIRHSSSGKDTKAVDRHNVVVSRSERDSDTGLVNTASASLTLVVPRTGQFTNAEIERLIGLLNEVIADDNLGKLLRGES